jgi:hypothetical protein
VTVASAREFLEALLREEVPSVDDLRVFLASKASNEGLLLDFKHSDELLKDKDKRNFTLRQYVAAFANSEGGVLAIGIQDKTKAIVPLTQTHQGRVGGDLKGWASRTVGDLTGALGAPPRFATVDVEGGQVLLVGVHRAPTLVSISKAGQAAYYFRIEDEAREVPASLVADLVLGRRHSPTLIVDAVPWKFGTERRESTTGYNSRIGSVITPEVLFSVTNDSLVSSTATSAGLIAWSFVESDTTKTPPIAGDLLARIEQVAPLADGPVHRLHHWPLKWKATSAMETDSLRRLLTLRPFYRFGLEMEYADDWSFSHGDHRHMDMEATAALYILPDGGEPLWFEVRVDVYGRTIQNAGQQAGRPIHATAIQPVVRRVVGQRPLVSLTAPKIQKPAAGGADEESH